MLYAINEHGVKVKANRQDKCSCPCCNAPVIAKMGAIKIHHWAHKHKTSSCPAGQGETDWHLKWKSYAVNKENVEVYFKSIKRRADILLNNNFVLELQNSSMTLQEYQERTGDYLEEGKSAIWLFNACDKHIELRKKKKSWVTFRWKWPSYSIIDMMDEQSKRLSRIYQTKNDLWFRDWSDKEWEVARDHYKIYLDLGDYVLKVYNCGLESPVGGAGHIRTKKQFIEYIKKHTR